MLPIPISKYVEVTPQDAMIEENGFLRPAVKLEEQIKFTTREQAEAIVGQIQPLVGIGEEAQIEIVEDYKYQPNLFYMRALGYVTNSSDAPLFTPPRDAPRVYMIRGSIALNVEDRVQRQTHLQRFDISFNLGEILHNRLSNRYKSTASLIRRQPGDRLYWIVDLSYNSSLNLLWLD